MMILSAIARGVGAGIIAGGGGSITVSSELYSTTAPVVSVTTTQDLLPTVGVQTTTSFSSTQAGHWEIASNIYGATISQASDGLSATITWTPQSYPVCSIYIAARCVNAGGSSIGVCRAHPGMRGVVSVGTGGDYSNLAAAFAAVKGFANPGGYAFVIKNGTYTASNMHIFYDGDTGNLPPCGEYTADTSGTDPVYTITRFTSVIAETPFGVIFDGQGTRYSGIDLQGNTDLEAYEQSVGWSNAGSLVAAGTDLRGIHLAGFVVDDMDNNGWSSNHCDHIFYEYGFCGQVARVTPNQNMTGIQFSRSTDCVMENMHTIGSARYKHSAYEAKRLAYRRLFQRFDELGTVEPHGGLSLYRHRHSVVSNVLHFDSDQLEDYDTGSFEYLGTTYYSQDAGFIALPSTGSGDGGFGYPKDADISRCLMINSRLGFSENDAREITTDLDSFDIYDVGAWYYKPNARQGAGCGIFQAGPGDFNRVTSVYCDNEDSQDGINCWHKSMTISNAVLYKFGHQYDGAGRGVNNFMYTPGWSTITITNMDNYDMSVNVYQYGETANITATNVRTNVDPTTQGMRYPGRMEVGSNYKTAGMGQDNFYLSKGKRGINWGMTGDDEDTGRNWMAEAMLELVLPLYQAYSHTGTKNSGGTGTISGDRGGAQSSRGIIDYVISAADRDVPFPLSTHIQTISGGHRITVRQFASYYMTNITSFKLYQNGTLFHTSTTKNMHGFDVTGLTTGASITTTAVDSVHGESGHSYAVTVP